MSPRCEPVAIIGMACRFPGAADLNSLWKLLAAGASAISDARTRWPDDATDAAAPAIRHGAFLDDVAGFDADFFDISPAEARAMDPQQRLALELAWEACEDAAILPAPGRQPGVAVFVGASASDYAALASRRGATAIGRHTMTGSLHAMLANLVSYVLG